ncbi:hypothetical protein HCJ70_16240 [Listeria booriae]|uniref:replicative helicase loader/inhibitor n=1 Tax=Listeria booriae TaxID=1552123 RepID=UPI00162ACEA7|nr:replicative helicase loader/inhibitor [Listeria booriae]MBC2100602.1 hypothetical protein [Listeria booriae]
MELMQAYQLIEIVSSAYPSFKKACDEKTLRLWSDMLQDADYEKSKAALIKHIKTKKFAPSLADFSIPSNADLSNSQAEMKAWEIIEQSVAKEMQNYTPPDVDKMPISEELKQYLKANRREVKTPFQSTLTPQQEQERKELLQKQIDELARREGGRS